LGKLEVIEARMLQIKQANVSHSANLNFF